MSPREIILEYLKFTETKSCTMVGILVLCEEFRISQDVLTFTLMEMVKYDEIIIEPNEPQYLTVIKLVPKLQILQ